MIHVNQTSPITKHTKNATARIRRFIAIEINAVSYGSLSMMKGQTLEKLHRLFPFHMCNICKSE